MSEIPLILSDDNFTILSRIIYQLEDGAELGGRSKSTVFVFTNLGKNLKYTFRENQKMAFADRIQEKIRKNSYIILSVTSLAKDFRYKTDFVFGDIKIPDMVVQIRIQVKKPEEIAIIYIEKGDPVKDLCFTVKLKLDKAFKEIYLADIEKLQQFTEDINEQISKVSFENPYFDVADIFVEFNVPLIEQAFQDIQKEKIQRKKIIAQSERDYEQVEWDFKLKELQLNRLGINDPKIRLLMMDPDKRGKYLDDIYQLQLEHVKECRMEDSEVLKIKRELLLKYFNTVTNDMTDIEEIERFLQLLDKHSLGISSETVLGNIIPEDKKNEILKLQQKNN